MRRSYPIRYPIRVLKLFADDTKQIVPDQTAPLGAVCLGIYTFLHICFSDQTASLIREADYERNSLSGII